MMGDLVGGQISMAFDATPTAMPQAQSGAIRALGAGMFGWVSAAWMINPTRVRVSTASSAMNIAIEISSMNSL